MDKLASWFPDLNPAPRGDLCTVCLEFEVFAGLPCHHQCCRYCYKRMEQNGEVKCLQCDPSGFSYPYNEEEKSVCKEHQSDLTSFCVTCESLNCAKCAISNNHEGHRMEVIEESVAIKNKFKNISKSASVKWDRVRVKQSKYEDLLPQALEMKSTAEDFIVKLQNTIAEINADLEKGEHLVSKMNVDDVKDTTNKRENRIAGYCELFRYEQLFTQTIFTKVRVMEQELNTYSDICHTAYYHAVSIL